MPLFPEHTIQPQKQLAFYDEWTPLKKGEHLPRPVLPTLDKREVRARRHAVPPIPPRLRERMAA